MNMLQRTIPALIMTSIGLLGAWGFLAGCSWSDMPETLDTLTPNWTRSFTLYKQPHAVWLDKFDKVGANALALTQALAEAKLQKKTPELVVYSIPLRDLGQASEGGFADDATYFQDKQADAVLIKAFVAETGIKPRIILEPDALSLSVQYREDKEQSPESLDIYKRRIALFEKMLTLYHDAGALVYLEGGHSDWFDYADTNIALISTALNEAGIAKADGLVTNVSNRQTVNDPSEPRNEYHYIGRLLPTLKNPKLDIIVDTSRAGREGGATKARQFYMHPDGLLFDNETPTGRLIGSWINDPKKGFTLKPFNGAPKSISRLTRKDKYKYDAAKGLLKAPAWLDAVGDVKLGPAPTDHPPAAVSSVIKRYRYIKPPDDCDGVLNCPAGQSKSLINEATQLKQGTAKTTIDPAIWMP